MSMKLNAYMNRFVMKWITKKKMKRKLYDYSD